MSLLEEAKKLHMELFGTHPNGKYDNLDEYDLSKVVLSLDLLLDQKSRRESLEQRRVRETEDSVATMIRYGAKNREQALRWIAQAS
jgi:hypothetical protein